jgi:hypothetical protein
MRLRQQRLYLATRQYNGQPGRLLCAGYAVQPGQVYAEHLKVKKQQGGKCLVLRRWRDMTRDSEAGQKGFHFGTAHLQWVALAVEKNVATYPLYIRLLGAQAVVFDPAAFAHEVEELGLTVCLHGSVSSLGYRSVCIEDAKEFNHLGSRRLDYTVAVTCINASFLE